MNIIYDSYPTFLQKVSYSGFLSGPIPLYVEPKNFVKKIQLVIWIDEYFDCRMQSRNLIFKEMDFK